MYEGVPHLLTPVIIDPKKPPTRCATRSRDGAAPAPAGRIRRAQHRAVQQEDPQVAGRAADLFGEPDATQEELRPLPYILILIDELAT